jgi:hypothetical protein
MMAIAVINQAATYILCASFTNKTKVKTNLVEMVEYLSRY